MLSSASPAAAYIPVTLCEFQGKGDITDSILEFETLNPRGKIDFPKRHRKRE